MSLGDDHGYGDTGPRGDDHEAYGGTGQTRTRLPEQDGNGAHGGVRRGRQSSSRGLVTVVGVVVLLIAAIAFANRGDADPTDDGTSGTHQAESPATAPSGERPVGTKTAGIPTGYPHNEQGAQSAAANYGIALGSTGMFHTAERKAIVDTVYAPDVAAARKPELDQIYSRKSFLSNIGLNEGGTPPSGQTFVSRVIPVGTKATSVSDSTAKVELWYTSLFGLSGEGSKNPVTESWFTTAYELKWVDGDWKVTDFTQKDGPVPVGRDQKASTAEDMTKAVEEYGGFTYAR